MASASPSLNGRTPNGQVAGTKRSAAEASLEISRDGKGKRFQGCSKISNYIQMSKLGEGTFGEVSKAECRVTGQIVALKKILMHQEKDGFPVTALREIKLLKMLSHPNVLKLEEMAMERDRSQGKKKATVYMVTPYMDHDLSGLLENPSVNLTEAHLKCYMLQLLEGLAYLHKSKILHRDMKAANLLINNEGNLQIADFGLARPYDDSPPREGVRGNGEATRAYTTVVVTRWYRPPELLLQLRHYTPAIDIWGVGCVFGEMFKKRPILPGNSDLNQLHLIFDLVGSPTEINMPGWTSLPGCEGVKTFKHRHPTIDQTFRDEGSEFIKLLKDLMMLDWRKRISAMEALQHTYFKTYPFPAKPGDIPQFQESHELDRRKFREQKANPPPAPAGGTVGMGPDGDFGHGAMPNGHGTGPLADGRGQYNNPQSYPPRRNGFDHRNVQAPYGSRVPPPPPAGPPPPVRRHAWERGPGPSTALPPRPPVEVPRGGANFPGARSYDGARERGPSDPPRERPPYDAARSRLRGGGPSQVDTYIPSYRDEAPRGRDGGYRARDTVPRRDDRADRRLDDRDVRRGRTRSPERDRDRERERNRDIYRR